ncbi:MAG TPA: hypothetical protein ENI23_03185, partial [bacterium]|nr:hypothetical protein [bacterium]
MDQQQGDKKANNATVRINQNLESSLDDNLGSLAKGVAKTTENNSVPQVSPTPKAVPVSTQLPSLTLNPGASQPIQKSKTAPSQSSKINSLVGTDFISSLIKKGVLKEEDVGPLKFESVSSGKSLESLIVEKGLLTEEDLYKAKAVVAGIPYIDLGTINISTEIIQKIPFDTAKKNNTIAFEEMPGKMKVAMLDPLDLQKVKFIGAVVGREVIPHYSSPSDIKRILDTKYSAKIEGEVEEALEDVGDTVVIGQTIGSEEDISANIGSAPVSRIVNMVLEYAVKFHASDVHIEPREGKVAVRYRLNGVMSERLTLPKKLNAAIVSRIKILSNLKIDEHRVPQDGRFQIKVGDASIDLRVSIMPSAYGEKVVMRLLEKGGGVMKVEDTGLEGPGLKVFRSALEKTQGIILVTGPTGSGKTQTLASSLKILNKQEVNIMTIEDPVEIRMDGITQVQVNTEVGLTFAKALRSFLRQDPDIIMVGKYFNPRNNCSIKFFGKSKP